MGYVDLTVAVAACYQKNVGTGAMIATMLPSSVLFLLGWTILFYLWVLVFGLPMGPGGADGVPPDDRSSSRTANSCPSEAYNPQRSERANNAPGRCRSIR